MAETGDTVKVHYTGTLADGTQFDSSVGKEPLEFTLGAGMVIAGFEEALTGMKAGQTKKVIILADMAYGQHRDDLVFDVDKGKLPTTSPQIGMEFNMRQEDGSLIPVAVIAVNEATVTLDANHPLAGKDLTFDLELVEVMKGK